MMKRLHLLIAFLIAAFVLQAQNIPSGYYNGTDGLTGTALRSKLHTIITSGDSHTSYNGLWTAYGSTDKKPGTNYIWDIYSDVPGGTPPYQYIYQTNQCGSYSGEGNCYNREHLWAQSWTNNDGTEKTDLHHVFPTDGKVNGMRSDYAFGEVASADWTSLNGSKLGTCKSSLGFSGTVFEPRDEFKGDIARALMYVSVRYYGDDSNWSTSDMTNKSEIKSWAITMLLRWHEEDPVSTKEINRNEAVYAIQHNRNPFVDHPEFAAAIWAPTATYQIIASANPSGAGTVSGAGTYTSGQTCTLTAAANTGYTFVSWTKNGTVVSTSASYSFTVTAAGTYQANFEENTCTIAVVANTSTDGSAFIGDSPSPSPVTTSVTFSDRYSSDTNLNGTLINFDDNNVSVVFNKYNGGNDPIYHNSTVAVRSYWGNNFVISAGDYTITYIGFTFASGEGSNTITPSVGTLNGSSWSGNSSSVTFTIGGTSGHRRIKSISVTYSGGSPVTQANFTNGATATITASPNANYSFVNWTKNGVHVSGDATYSFTVTESATYTANFMSNTVSSNTTIASLTLNGTVTVNSDKTLTVTGNITQPEGSSISILNGGQLVCNNSVYVKMQKSITAWNGSKGWYAIASPVDNQAFVDVVNLVNTANNPLHNIYRYDEAGIEWEEYRDSQNIFNSFENGRGYLFRTANTGGMIEFKGDNNVDAFNYDLSYACDNNNFKGFNLLGNPFTQNITWANLVKANVATEGYYILEESGANQGKWTLVTSSATIAPMRAFLVQATGNNPSVTISRSAGKEDDRVEADNIMFAVSNSKHSDEAYVKFKQGHGLNKIEHRNAEIPMLYVIDNDEHFAIADVDDNTNVINLGFEAKTMGQYTLSLKAEGDFRCLHLIDRITGEDVDMLIEDEYSFIAAPADAKNRFVVKCRCNSAANADDDVFAYQNGDDMIVEGNGILQIFDVTGRIIANHNVNGVEIIGKPTRPGLYVFRLVGEDVKTQKIVVK